MRQRIRRNKTKKKTETIYILKGHSINLFLINQQFISFLLAHLTRYFLRSMSLFSHLITLITKTRRLRICGIGGMVLQVPVSVTQPFDMLPFIDAVATFAPQLVHIAEIKVAFSQYTAARCSRNVLKQGSWEQRKKKKTEASNPFSRKETSF